MKRLLSVFFLLTALTYAMNFSGTYYLGPAGSRPGGGNPDFLSLRDMCDSLNAGTFGGNTTIFITGDVFDTLSSGLAFDPGNFTVTLKPYTGANPTITILYPTDANGGPSGAWVIGLKRLPGNIDWNNLAVTKNFIIDGSNTPNGSTRNLTITNATNSHRNAIPILLCGDVSNVVIKNCYVYYKAQGVSTSGNLFLAPIILRSRNNGGVDWVPSNIQIEGNFISGHFPGVYQNVAGIGTYQTGTPVPLNYPNNVTARNNVIEGKRRGIALYRAGSWNIYGNFIKANLDVANDLTCEGIYAADIDTGSVVNIYNNAIGAMAKDSVAANTICGINIESFGTYHIYNNFISKLDIIPTLTNPFNVSVIGIRQASANATANISFNSLLVDGTFYNAALAPVVYAGMVFNSGTAAVLNNIVVAQALGFRSMCITKAAAASVTSNYNDFFAPQHDSMFVGAIDNTTYKTLANWAAASSGDANSISANPGFVSSSDLHLSSFASPVVGKGTAVSGIQRDFDNQIRDTPPEIGADEFPGFVPVEMVSFSATVSGAAIVLNWSTASEQNNRGFEVQRLSTGAWESIGFVAGSGTTVSSNSYSFTDENAGNGALRYRIKQIDFDGTFSYSTVAEVWIGFPAEFKLSQNYPNPFNPSTVIAYTLPEKAFTRLAVYDVAGREVTVLAAGEKDAGQYSVVFDASKISSGIYFYKLTAAGKSLTKKLIVSK